MNQKIRVLYVSSELAPFAKSGEMADVASSLPKYLSALGVEVAVVMPRYRRPEIDSLDMDLVEDKLPVSLGEERVKARAFKAEPGHYRIYLIDNPKYFLRENIYGTEKGDYLDNDERFIFFNRAVLEFVLKKKMEVDIIHCNNWPTALIPLFLKTHYAHKAHFRSTATVLTLHNIAYQGDFPPETLSLTGLDWSYFNPQQLSFDGRFNFLKAGIMFSDVLNTVSSTYKREIQREEHSFGLDRLLKKRRDVFFSIRNGIDCEVWNPETDPFIAANYSLSDLKPKRECKLNLIDEFGLKMAEKTPLLGVVSYLTSYKGFDILFDVVDELMAMEVGLVVLGKGEEKYGNALLKLRERYPQRIGVKLEMSQSLAHKVAAGADMLLIPSLYEPCGLHQLYSFRYGTVPVVRATGGLRETVRPFNPRTGRGNGFVFKEYSARAFLHTFKTALQYYRQPPLWLKIMKAGLEEDFSWDTAARKYIRLYRKALKLRRGGKSWSKKLPR
ncbi:MAG: glycogen synthase [Candidatus Aminicenantales bacterium]